MSYIPCIGRGTLNHTDEDLNLVCELTTME
jgi:hypothetical protein